MADAAQQFAAISETPRLDAELLMAHALGIERGALLMTGLDGPPPPAFADLMARRLLHEPVAYITGTRAFWTIELAVEPGVLIPRADSETLLEAAVAQFAGGSGPASVLDLGTGSGALLLAALDQWPVARGVGLDASPAAVEIARANARRLGLDDRARIAVGDWRGRDGPHDLILCNPPYVAANADLPREVAGWEPAAALYAGPDGLDDYRLLAPLLGPQLAPGGVACVETGATQAAAVGALFAAQGLDVRVRRDLAGCERCLVLTRLT